MKTFLILAMLATFAYADDTAPVHKNRTSYGNLQTNIRAEHFYEKNPGFAEVAKGLFIDLEKRAQTDFTLQIHRPTNLELFDVYVRRVPVSIERPSAPLQCDKPQEAIFLHSPPDDKGKIRSYLYSYRYLVCAGGKEVSPARLLEKYIERYGNYDKKDFDRKQAVYYNVKGRYELRVQPVTATDGNSGLEISVADSEAFMRVYEAWRSHIRHLEEEAQEKF